MSKPMVRIHDTANDKIIDREMSDAEFAQYQSDQQNNAKIKAEIDAKIIAKTALLKKLNITEAEAELLNA
jgi:hypothetical protein